MAAFPIERRVGVTSISGRLPFTLATIATMDRTAPEGIAMVARR
jgi:hypothetical protein